MIDDITDDRLRADRNISFLYWCIFMALRRGEMKITGSNVQNVRSQAESKWGVSDRKRINWSPSHQT